MVIWIYKSKAQAPISFILGLLTVYLEVDSLRDWVANLQHLIVIETKIAIFVLTIWNLVGCLACVVSAVLKADPPKDQGPVVQNLHREENDKYAELLVYTRSEEVYFNHCD